MQPCSSTVSNVPSTMAPPEWIATPCPSPAARSSQSRRISPKPWPWSQIPRNSAHESDSTANNSSAPIWTPSAASEVAGVGVPSGAAMTLVPMPTTTPRRPPATASASSRMPASFSRPARTSLGHFSEYFISSDPAALSDASTLTFCSAASSASPAAKPSVAATAGETSITSRMLLARLPRGAIHGRCRLPRPAVCSDVTNHFGPRSPSRALDMASALVEPIEGSEPVTRRYGPRPQRKCHLKQRFRRDRCHADQRPRIDEEKDIEQASDREHGAQFHPHRIELDQRLIEIHHLDDAEIVKRADHAGEHADHGQREQSGLDGSDEHVPFGEEACQGRNARK